MKIRYLGKDSLGSFVNNKIYEVVGQEKGFGDKAFYRVIDESGEGYLYQLYDKAKFEIIED